MEQQQWSERPSQHPLLGGALRVLVVDSKAASRLNVVQLLRDCAYSVYGVRTTKEALQLLTPAASGSRDAPFDIIVKEHEPPEVSANKLLRRMARTELLSKIPVVLVSSNDDRDVVMKCLTLGAIDYLIKPLRHNELRHIWTRVFIWRKSGLGSGEPHALANIDSIEFQESSEDGKDTKCDDDEEPTSKEGSAPDNGNGSKGNGGSNGNGTSGHNHGSNGNGNGASGNGASRVEAKQHAGDGSGNNDNSGSKNGHHNGHGSNGNGAATSLAEQNALLNTAEGKPPPNAAPGKDTIGRSFRPYSQEGSRKRPAAAMQGAEPRYDSAIDAHHRHHQRQHPAADNESNMGMVLDASARHQGDSWRTSAEDAGSGDREVSRQQGGRARTGAGAEKAGVGGGGPLPMSHNSTASDVVMNCSMQGQDAAAPAALTAGAVSAGAGHAARGDGAGGSGAAAAGRGGACAPPPSTTHTASEDTIHAAARCSQQHAGAGAGPGDSGGSGGAGARGTGTSGTEPGWGGRTSAFSAPGQSLRVSGGLAGLHGSGSSHEQKAAARKQAAGSVGGGGRRDASDASGAAAGGNASVAPPDVGPTAAPAATAAAAVTSVAPLLGAQASMQTQAGLAGGMLGVGAGGLSVGARLGMGMGMPGSVVGLPGAWGQQQAMQVLQASMQGGHGHGHGHPLQGGHAPGFQPPLGMAPGALFPSSVPFPSLLGVPPHLLHQLHPQALQALLAGPSLTSSLSQGSQGVDSAFSGVQAGAAAATSLYSPFPGLYMPQAAALLSQQVQLTQQQQAWQQQQQQQQQVPVAHHVAIAPMPMFLGQAPSAWPTKEQQQMQLDGFRAASSSLPQSALAPPSIRAPGPRATHPSVYMPVPPVSLPGPTPLVLTPSTETPPSGGVDPAVVSAAAADTPPLRSAAGLEPCAVAERPSLHEQRKRRAAALAKYRTKRQNLKFGKVIRYESRKQLAQQRLRVKGQFVKQGPFGADDGGDAAGMDVGRGEEDTQDEGGDAAGRRGRGGFGGQNFDEGGGYDRSPEDDTMEEDEDGGGGGSGTEAGDGLQRAAGKAQQRPAAVAARRGSGDKTPESEEVELPVEVAAEECGEEDDDEVVNSLRKLRDGAPRPAASTLGPSVTGGNPASAHKGSAAPAAAAALGAAAGAAPGSSTSELGGGLQGSSIGPKRGPKLGSYSPGGQKLASCFQGGSHHGGAEPAGARGASGARPLSRLVVVGTRGGVQGQQGQQGQGQAAAGTGGHAHLHAHDAGGHCLSPTGGVADGGGGGHRQAAGERAGGGGHSNKQNGGSDSGSNSLDENGGGNGHGKGGAGGKGNMKSHGSGDGGSGHGGSQGGSDEASGHGGAAEKGAGHAGLASPGCGRRHDKQ